MKCNIEFNAFTNGFSIGTAVWAALLFFLVSLLWMWQRKRIRASLEEVFVGFFIYPQWLPFVAVGFLVLYIALALISEYVNYSHLQELGARKELEIVTGRVEEFSPMPWGRGQVESFRVGDRRFSYSDFDNMIGYHKSLKNGGLIKEGELVRISFKANDIFVIEICE